MGIKINGVQIAGIGAPGKSAYDYAKDGGYIGTEDEFKQLMAGPIPIAHGGTNANEANQARKNLGAAAVIELTQAEYDALDVIDSSTIYIIKDATSFNYTYGTEDLVAGVSELPTGALHFVYE